MAASYRLSRHKSGIYYYLRKVPKRLVPLAGKAFIKRSLKTSDLEEAKSRRSIEELRADTFLANCEAQIGDVVCNQTSIALPSNAALLEYVRAAIEADNGRTAKAYADDPPSDDQELQEMRADAEFALQVLGSPDNPNRSQAITSFGKKTLKQAGVDDAALALPYFVELTRQSLIELHNRKIARYDDEADKIYFNPVFNPATPKTASFSDLANAYIALKTEEYAVNGISKKQDDKVRSTVRTLVEIVGAETKTDKLDYMLVQSVRTTLAQMPSRRSTLYRGFPLSVAIEKGKADGRALLSAGSQQFYLDEFRGILQLAKAQKYIVDNPAEMVKPLKKSQLSAADKRLPLTDEQLKKFFNSNFYQSCSSSAANPYKGKDRAWRFWMPLIMLFSGARPNEVAQLRAHDVRTSPKGTIYFDFTNEADAEEAHQLKTINSRRQIPIHKELMMIGIMTYVAQRRQSDGENALLFPTLKPNKYKNLAWYPVKRFNEVFLPKEAGLKNRQSLYSLRHNLRDAFRRVDATPEVLQAIGGWAPASKSVSDHYGDAKNPDLYKKWVDRIVYDCLDLSGLYGAAV